MNGKGEDSWRCVFSAWKFCPPEGCPKFHGCAREHGWKLGQPSPDECTGKVTTINLKEILSVR